MKQLLFLFLFLLITVELNASLIDGCKGYYSFNNHWTDASPSNLTAGASDSLSFVDGVKDQGVFLDGIDDYISLGKANFVDRLTITFWMKFPQQPESWQPIISKYDESGSDQALQMHSFYIRVLGQTLENKLYFTVSEDGQQTFDITSQTMIEKEIWYHVVAMFQPGRLVLVINGKKEAEKETPVQQLFVSSVPIIMGSMLKQGKTSEPFANVILDEVRLYNRNLSMSEIMGLYEQKSGPEVISHEPYGIVNHKLSYVDIHFNAPIISSLLTYDDFILVAPDQYTITVNMPKKLSISTYRFSFAPQETNGLYHFQLGPGIYDYTGNALNQDHDELNGEPEDIYTGEFQLNAMPDKVMLVNMGPYDSNAQNILRSFSETDAEVIYIILDSSDQENALVNKLTQLSTEYQQIWIFDTSPQDGKYPNAMDAISMWFLEKQGRKVICDGRMRASFWMGNWQTIGKKLTGNYYENLKLNGGGLLLATDKPEDQPDMNSICEKIGISAFGAMATYESVEIDPASYLMSYPNQLETYLESSNKASMVPTGKQPNGSNFYCVAWNPENSKNCSISTSILPLIPTNLTAEVKGNSIELSWKPAQPEFNVAYYNVYLSQSPFTNVSGLQPYTSMIDDTTLTISSLTYGQTYYVATTAVNQLDNEQKNVTTVSATIESSSQGAGGDDGGGCFLNILY